jgi:hypothetical protein
MDKLTKELIDKFDELVEAYYPWLDVKSPKDRKLISKVEGEIASLKIQLNIQL